MTIGLTGNSGSGKSSVAAILKNDYGAYIIDADEIAHEVILKTGPAYAEVTGEFGGEILNPDGEIDRKRLGRLVFTDDNRRRRLIEITHKHIIAEMRRRLERASGEYPHVLMDAPLLIEAGLHRDVDTVWLVSASEEVKLSRITARDRISVDEARARLMSQTPFEELEKYADAVIDNSRGLDELRAEVKRVIENTKDTREVNL